MRVATRIASWTILSLAATEATAAAQCMITNNPADVPGVAVQFRRVAPSGDLALFDGVRVGASVEAARTYSEAGRPAPMGFRFSGDDRALNGGGPVGPTSLEFRFDTPVAAAGAWFAGSSAQVGNPASSVTLYAYNEAGQTVFEQTVHLPAADGSGAEVFVGLISVDATIKRIQFEPNGGIACRDLRPGGPATGWCVGDANGDRVVDFIDVNGVLSDFGQTSPSLAGDLDFDGDCDFVDLNIVLGAFGVPC